MSLHTQIAPDRESLRLIESTVDDSWSTFDDDTWPSFTSCSFPLPSPTSTSATRQSRRTRSSRCKEAATTSPSSSPASPSWNNGTGRSEKEEEVEGQNPSSNSTTMHVPSSPLAALMIDPSATTKSFNAKGPDRLAQCRSDDTPVMSNVVEAVLKSPSAAARDDVNEVSALLLEGSPPMTTRRKTPDDSTSSSSSNELEDDFTVSRINVSDTDLFRSESPGCIRLTEHGLKAFEMQQQASEEPVTVTPQAFTAGRMRHVHHPRRPRPRSTGDLRTYEQEESPSTTERRASYHSDGTKDVVMTSHSSRVLAPCPEDCATTFAPSPASSPEKRAGGGLLSSLRGRRCGAGADEGDASSVTPLCDSDKLVSNLTEANPATTLLVSDTPESFRRRRRFFGLLRGGAGAGSHEDKAGRKKGVGKNQQSHSQSTASQKFLEQVSAQEAKERQKMAEERERRRIEQKRRAYLQQQRAKEMSKRGDDEDAMTRPSSSRTAVTVQSSLFDDESLLLRSRVSSRSTVRSQSTKSKATTNDSAVRRESGMFREFGDFLFAETCTGTFQPDVGSNASSTAMTTAPNTRSMVTNDDDGDDRIGVRGGDTNQNALLPPCVVCKSAERTHVATPCFHFLYCAKCSKRLPACVACHQPAKFRPINM